MDLCKLPAWFKYPGGMNENNIAHFDLMMKEGKIPFEGGGGMLSRKA